MRRKKSVNADEIMRDYYRELRWKERIARKEEGKNVDKMEEKNGEIKN